MISRYLRALLLAFVCSFSFPLVSYAEPVDINTASAEQLTSLNGIGPAKAEAILAYRESHGPFTSVEQLLEVKGIGSATLEKNRAALRVESTSSSSD